MKISIYKAVICVLIFISSSTMLIGQTLSHSVYLIGNTADSDAYHQLFNTLKESHSEANKSTILVLGDITDENGFSNDPGKENAKRLDAFKQLGGLSNMDIYFLGGDRDWDNSGKKGMQKINDLEKYIEKELKLKKAFVPSEACPGPKTIEIAEDLVVIAINSQWFIHPFDKPESPDTDCKVLTSFDFFEELESVIEDNEGKNVIIMAHHPIYSYGPYAGKKLGNYHLIPVIGSFYLSYRKYIGSSRDMAHPDYKHFRDHMKKMLLNFQSLVYASGHEHHNSILREENNIFINTSASDKVMKAKKTESTMYLKNAPGFTRLDYFDDGLVKAENYYLKKGQTQSEAITVMASSCNKNEGNTFVNTAVNPCQVVENNSISQGKTNIQKGDTLVIASLNYEAGGSKRYWLGDQYRDEWAQPINVPFLNLDSLGGGVAPYAKGGGLQTISLKFKGKDKNKYAFRKVDKNPEKGLSEDIRKTIYKDLVKDLIASQHPYGGLVASRLMDEAGILHSKPSLFVMPDDPALGEYREEFAGAVGTIELKPKGKSKKRKKGFADADEVVKSHQMFRSMFKDADNRIDKKAYAKARVFDMWMGDWDRHEDNWIWAMYEKEKGNTFIPIPKDRDHVFSRWTGVIPGIADKVIMNAEHFDYQVNNVTHLNFKARWLDRQLGNELDKKDWLEASHFIQEVMTDDVIDKAFEVWPKEIYDLKGEEIKAKLRSRRDHLDDGVERSYMLLAKEVDVIGSNKRELFEVNRLDENRVLVEMFKVNSDGEKKQKLYSRTFSRDETKVIYLYGLSGKDIFHINGTVDKSIKVRVIGGDKKDDIKDESIVRKGPKMTEVFDHRKEDNIEKGQETFLNPSKQEVVYNSKQFEYGSLLPLPAIKQSSGNRFGIGLDLSKIDRGFHKPLWAHQYNIYTVYYPSLRANRLEVSYRYRHVVGTSDLLLQQAFSTFYDQFPFYYGVGSRTDRNEDLLEADYYRTDFVTARTKIGLEKSIIRKSHFNTYLLYEYNNVKAKNEENSIFNEEGAIPVTGLGKKNIFGFEIDFELDFRDSDVFTKNGSMLSLNNKVRVFENEGTSVFNNSEIVLAQYQTYNLFTETTLSARAGALLSFGDAPFYHKSVLGSNTYLRGFTRNRFLDDYAVFYNVEARFHLGTISTVIVPLRIGMFGFYDRGKVWGQSSFSDNIWNAAVGGGLYIAPIKDIYNINFYLARSSDKGVYFDYNMGWRF